MSREVTVSTFNKALLFSQGQKWDQGASIPDKVHSKTEGTPSTPKPNTSFDHISTYVEQYYLKLGRKILPKLQLLSRHHTPRLTIDNEITYKLEKKYKSNQ